MNVILLSKVVFGLVVFFEGEEGAKGRAERGELQSHHFIKHMACYKTRERMPSVFRKF